MRKLKNKIKGNFRKNVTKAAVIAAAGFGAVSVTVPTFAAEMQHHCSCGENHDDPNCTCGCQEAKALVALTQGEYETSQATLSEKLEAQKKLQEQLDAAKKVHEEYVEALKAAIAENEAKAQAALDEAQAVLDSANAASEEAQAAFTAAQTEYDEALGALREAEEAYSALEEANPDIENEYNEAINALEEAQKELDQAVQEEEAAQSEKDEADRQAEDARKKREDARSARERAKEAADAAEKRRVEAEEAKKKVDAAKDEAQSKYNEADETYSYKKGLADGTIPIETTPEWEEAKKTQEALDAATADKEKADAELKTAEDDLSEKEKALEAANADYEEKSKVCEETREQLRKAREELEAAQQENKEDKEALDAAKSEKDAADKDVENKTNELAAADKALEDAKKAQEDAQQALADAEKAKKEAEEALQKHKDEQRNSVAFCKWVVENSEDENLVKDARAALDIYEKHMGEGARTVLTGNTDLTDEKDATGLNNMLESVKFIEETNALREHEGQDPVSGSKLSELKISLKLMMIAELQLNWSDTEVDHSRAENVGENLAWGQYNNANVQADLNDPYGSDAGPYAKWYTIEKENYQKQEQFTDSVGELEFLIENENSDLANYESRIHSAQEQLRMALEHAGHIIANEREELKREIENSGYPEDNNPLIRELQELDDALNEISDYEEKMNNDNYMIGTDNLEWLRNLPEKYGDHFGQTGHYLNIVRYYYNITGFAYNQGAAAKYGSRAYGQTFSTDRSNPEAYPTVEAFSALLNSYADKTNTEQEELEKAVEAAKKALEDANTSLTNAKQDVTDKTNEKTAAQKALDDSEKNQTDKTKALEDATAKEATSAKRIQDAETALGLRTEENDTAEQDLTAAEEVKNTAQEEKDTAAGVKDEKQKEADSKNETFTEAKGKDDAADRAVQDLLDGKEVPTLEQEANAAKEELDKATGDQAAADTELKAAEDDSKAKADDLSAKTAEEEAAVKDQEDKEAAAKAKAEALTSAIENKNAKEGIKNAAEEKAAETKKRLDDKNNAETAKNNAQTKSDDAKAKADDAKSKADAAASDAAKASSDADSAKQALDAAKALNADDALKSDDDSYNQFKEAIDAVKGAIVSEDDANAKYTEAEAESVVAEADEKTKKEAYDKAVAEYATVHEHCGHDEMTHATYNCTAGNGNVWTKQSGKTSDFTFERSHEDETAFSHFTAVYVDGKKLSASDYTASAGSVIVKLSDKFLETLAVGDHTIKAEFDDGSAEAKFTVRAASGSGTVTETKKTTPVKTAGAAQQVITTPSANVQTAQKAPATGDTGAAVWIISAAASAAVIAGAVLYRRKRADRG